MDLKPTSLFFGGHPVYVEHRKIFSNTINVLNLVICCWLLLMLMMYGAGQVLKIIIFAGKTNQSNNDND